MSNVAIFCAYELAIELTLYRSLEVRRFHIITPPFRYDVKSVYPSFRTISVRQGVICCRNLKKIEKIFSGTKKARTKHIVLYELLKL